MTNVNGSDAPARRRILSELDSTFFVEAGAGTGKTTQLVGRIISLIAGGAATVAEVAAITFTEAAAGELRDRIAEALERVAAGTLEADDPISTVLDSMTGSERDGARERARRALGDLDRAAVTTLHGFARRILSEHPFEAGLPPGFEVDDEIRSQVAFGERWGSFLDELFSDPELVPDISRAELCGVTVDHLNRIAASLNDSWDLIGGVSRERPAPRPASAIDVHSVLAPLDQAAGLAESCTDDGDILRCHIVGLAGYRTMLSGVDGDIEAVMALVDAPRLTCRQGRAANWKVPVDDVRALLVAAEEERTDQLARVGSEALSVLVDALGRFVLRSAEERRRDGRLEFHDLLVRARDLVRDSPSVRQCLHEQYRFLLVDEFQDTDPIQAELALMIASGRGPEGGGGWTDLDPEPGRLFFVGDSKQSIYRFRRADVALYRAVGDRFADGSERLSRNHRSVPGVIDWVNEAFRILLGGDGVRAFVDLEAHRDAHGDSGDATESAPPVVVFGDEIDANVGEVRRAESTEVAQLVDRIVAEGWPVGAGEAARRQDICILVPRRTVLAPLEGALDAAGIPYRVESSSLVYTSEEVLELLMVLRAVDDPGDAISVVGALRSGLFACGDDDLLRWRTSGGSWDYRDPSPSGAGSGAVHRAVERLAELHSMRAWCEPGEIVDRIVEDRRMMEFALDGPRFREAWRRLRFVADQARRYSDATGGDLRGYLAWVVHQSEDGARVDEAVLPESDYDAVRIMTVHKSKGLEFPVVIVAGLNARQQVARGVRVLWGDDGPEVYATPRAKTGGFDTLDAADRVSESDEAIRLLYVAATRARDHLLVSLHHKKSLPCLAQRLLDACNAAPHLLRRPGGSEGVAAVRPSSPPVVPSVPTGGDGRSPATPEGRLSWLEGRARRLAGAAEPRVVAATSVASALRGRDAAPEKAGAVPVDHAPDSGTAGDGAPWRRGRAGTAIGRAVHGTLQAIDLESGDGVETVARSQSVAEGVGTSFREVENLVRSALESETIRWVVRARYWREVYVGAPVGERVLEGFVDLLVECDDGFAIVDYKTDALRDDADIDRAVERYRHQAAAYALAVEKAARRPVKRCTFLFLRPGGAVSRDVGDLAAAKAEVARYLEAP